MANNFLIPLKNAIKSMNANFNDAYAMSLAQGGIINDTRNIAANLAERNSTVDAKGTKCP